MAPAAFYNPSFCIFLIHPYQALADPEFVMFSGVAILRET